MLTFMAMFLSRVCVCLCVLIYRGNSSYSKCHDQFHTLSGKVVLLMCICENVCVRAAVFEYLKLTWLTPNTGENLLLLQTLATDILNIAT